MMKKILILLLCLILSSVLISCSDIKNNSNQSNAVQVTEQNDENEPVDIEKYVGSYSYDEFLPPNIYLEYSLNIYKENDAYLATILIDGYQTFKTINARVVPNTEGIDLVYDSTLNDTELNYKDGDVLLKLYINDFGAVITDWQEISANYDGRYFNKLQDVFGTWNVKEAYKLNADSYDIDFCNFEMIIDEKSVTSEKLNYSNLTSKNSITSFEAFYEENDMEILKVEPISSGFAMGSSYTCVNFYDESENLVLSACAVSEEKCILVDCTSETVYLLEK